MKFSKPKEDSAKETAASISATIGIRQTASMQARTDSMDLIEDIAGLLNHGPVFAQHCSAIQGIGGLEGILILRSILDEAELDPESSILDRILQEFKDSEANELYILVIDYDDAVRQSLGKVISMYFNSADNGFKPKPSDLAEAISKAGKVGSIDDLVAALEAKLNLKGKK